jgi:hypothetical protein
MSDKLSNQHNMDQVPTLESGTAQLYEASSIEPAQEAKVMEREQSTKNDKQ